MNKNEYLIEDKRLSVQKLRHILEFLSRVAFYATVLIGTWLVFWGIRPLLLTDKTEVINAFAGLIDKLGLSTILGYIWAFTSTGLYVAERRSKKRAIRLKSSYQHQAEQGEPNRTSSGLTDTGDTPMESENA